MLIAMFLGVIALAGARGPWCWLTIPYVALVTGGLLASGSRGSWVGVAAGAAVFAVLYGWANREAIRRHAVKVAAVLILLVGAVGVSVAVWGNDYAARRFDSIFELDRNRDRSRCTVPYGICLRPIRWSAWGRTTLSIITTISSSSTAAIRITVLPTTCSFSRSRSPALSGRRFCCCFCIVGSFEALLAVARPYITACMRCWRHS